MLGGLPIVCMKFLFPKEFITIFGLGQYPLQRTSYLFCSFFSLTSSRFFILLLPPQPNYVLLYSHDHESCDFNIHISTHGIILALIFWGIQGFLSSPFQRSNGLQGATQVYSNGMSIVLKNISMGYDQCRACVSIVVYMACKSCVSVNHMYCCYVYYYFCICKRSV